MDTTLDAIVGLECVDFWLCGFPGVSLSVPVHERFPERCFGFPAMHQALIHSSLTLIDFSHGQHRAREEYHRLTYGHSELVPGESLSYHLTVWSRSTPHQVELASKREATDRLQYHDASIIFHSSSSADMNKPQSSVLDENPLLLHDMAPMLA